MRICLVNADLDFVEVLSQQSRACDMVGVAVSEY
jgi:hypothetical protein